MEDNVYNLGTITDDPRFHGFVFADHEELSLLGLKDIYRDFSQFDFNSRDYKIRPLGGKWRPREVNDRDVRAINDFPGIVGIPAFSQRAVDALRDLLEPNGELLRLKNRTELGRYYAYNVLTQVDALDRARSDIIYILNSVAASYIPHYEFFPKRLVGLSIFKIPESPSAVYVTETFAQRVREHNLQGFHLAKVWPLPPHVNWFKLGQEELEKMPGRPRRRKSKPVAAEEPQKLSVRPLKGVERESLDTALANYQSKLGIDADAMTPDQVQTWLFHRLEKVRASNESRENKEDSAFWIAMAWGQTLVREFGWGWTMLESDEGARSIAVVSPDGSRVVAVLQYIKKLLNPATDPTSQLLFNMIKAGKLSDAKAGELKLLS